MAALTLQGSDSASASQCSSPVCAQAFDPGEELERRLGVASLATLETAR